MAKKKDKKKDKPEDVTELEPGVEAEVEAESHDQDHEGHDHEGHDHDHDHDHDHGHSHGPSEEDLAEMARRRALQQIRQYPDPALKLRANEVEEFDSDLAVLIERMQNLMFEAQGVGLAANQIGILQRVFVFAPKEGEVQAVVNPQIVDPSKGTETDEEGCLSLQGVRVPVERHEKIVLEGKDPAGRDIRLELDGLAARAVQHEIDHLDGILIIDRTSPENYKEAMRVLRPQPVLR